MNTAISHDRWLESSEEKARWFQSLSRQEGAELLYEYTDLILTLNPRIVERKYAQPVPGRILIVKKA